MSHDLIALSMSRFFQKTTRDILFQSYDQKLDELVVFRRIPEFDYDRFELADMDIFPKQGRLH